MTPGRRAGLRVPASRTLEKQPLFSSQGWSPVSPSSHDSACCLKEVSRSELSWPWPCPSPRMEGAGPRSEGQLSSWVGAGGGRRGAARQETSSCPGGEVPLHCCTRAQCRCWPRHTGTQLGPQPATAKMAHSRQGGGSQPLGTGSEDRQAAGTPAPARTPTLQTAGPGWSLREATAPAWNRAVVPWLFTASVVLYNHPIFGNFSQVLLTVLFFKELRKQNPHSPGEPC